MAKQVSVKDIQAKIAKLEEERARLMPLRKEEIYRVLEASGGLALDNKVLAGFAVYANSEAAKKGDLLAELAKLGKEYLPRHSQGKSRGSNINASKAVSLLSTKIEETQVDG